MIQSKDVVFPAADLSKPIPPLPPVTPSIGTSLDLDRLRKPGRPKGSPDRFSRRERKFLKMSFWFGELKKDWKLLTPHQRATLCFDFIHLLIDKAKNLPQNPNDSRKSASDIMSALQELEGPPVVAGDDSGKSTAFNLYKPLLN
jgi:hypothetical protein